MVIEIKDSEVLQLFQKLQKKGIENPFRMAQRELYTKMREKTQKKFSNCNGGGVNFFFKQKVWGITH